MTYLEQIVRYVRSSSLSFHNEVYMGNDINAIDTAYSETQNHKVSVFFVPSDTVTGSGDFGRLIEKRHFNAYIFVPVEEDVASTEGWETATDVVDSLTGYIMGMTPSGAVSRIRPENSREFRAGRGYYIYLVVYSLEFVNSNITDTKTVNYFRYTGETNGVATYTKQTLNYCTTDENFSLFRTVNGIYRSYGCEVLAKISSNLNCTQKDWFIVGDNPGSSITSKSAALAAGFRVYEVNQWKLFYDISNYVVGIRFVGA